MADGLRVRAYDPVGNRVKDVLIPAPTEAPEFYVHQLLHADNVACVQVLSEDEKDLLLQQCDPDKVEAVSHGDLA